MMEKVLLISLFITLTPSVILAERATITDRPKNITSNKTSKRVDYNGPYFMKFNNNKYGYINNSGEVVIEPIFNGAGIFIEGLAPVKIGTSWGYIDDNMEVIIPPQYDDAGHFNYEGLSLVRIGRDAYFINKNDSKIMTYYEKYGRNIEPGGFIDKVGSSLELGKKNPFGGKTVTLPQYDDLLLFPEGLRVIKVNGKWGYMNESGIKYEASYDDAANFSSGLARIKKNGKWGFINKDNKIIIETIYDDVGNFAEDAAKVKAQGKWGYINKNGESIISTKYDYAWDFSGGKAKVRFQGEQKHINKVGEIIGE